jgi:S-adenosyl methyltransferase
VSLDPSEPDEAPSAARMYDYLLGGYHNFAPDRQAAEVAASIYPDFPFVMRANRAFPRRSVEFLAAQGIDQFLDLGSGIPTAGNVHEVVGQLNPKAHVVYVDVDLIAVSQSAALLQDVPNATIVQADARQPAAILAHPETQRLLDLSRPLAVLMAAFLHFVTDDSEAMHVVQALRDAMPSGSYMVISHATHEGIDRETAQQMERLYERTKNPVATRTRDQMAAFFEGLTLVEPGIVYTPQWRPEGPDDVMFDQPERSYAFAAVGYKP